MTFLLYTWKGDERRVYFSPTKCFSLFKLLFLPLLLLATIFMSRKENRGFLFVFIAEKGHTLRSK